MLSMKARYALKALAQLARRHGSGPVPGAEVASGGALPRKYMETILQELARHGIVDSKPGRGGGYVLAKPPAEIALLTVVRIVDGPVALLPCVSETAYARCADCDESTCGLRRVVKDVHAATAGILGKATVADLAAEEAA
jgi:Rrf2 family protein